MGFSAVTMKLLEGFGQTCFIFLMTLICAMPLGLVISFGSMSTWRPFSFLRGMAGFADTRLGRIISELRPISAFVRIIVWIVRGTPLMLQVIIVFYGPGLIFGISGMGRLEAVLAAFILNYACYFSEIFRGGIQSIPKGQYEAGQVLGMTKRQIFFKIILLQVIKSIVPPMSNEIITLVKDTSLARVIAVREIIMEAEAFISTYALIWPLFYSGAFYLLFCGVLTILFGYVERKLSYFRV